MGTALEKYREKLAAKGKTYNDEEKVTSSFITTRGGILKLGDEVLPGNEMCVIILDSVHENTYYPDAFDADVQLPPVCFSFGRNEDEMQPHANVPDDKEVYMEAQSEWCDECPWSQWGSADKGKGKACSNRRRLAMIPAGVFNVTGKGRKAESELEIYEDAEHFRKADMAFMKLPVTSTKNWAKYVKSIYAEHQLPPFAVLTHIYIEAHEKDQFHIHFDQIEPIEDEDILEAIFARHEEAMDAIEQPYNEPSPDDLQKPKTKARSGLKGLKNKRKR